MKFGDFIRLTAGALVANRQRSLLTALGIAVGIASVVLLTSIGEGVNRYVLSEFTQFGSNLIAITPGKTQTFGISGALVSTVRPLTLDDAKALQRIEGVVAVQPTVQGNASVKAGARSRRAMVLGAGAKVPEVWSMRVAAGRFLPADEGNPRPFAVLGAKLYQELFHDHNALGQRVRIGEARYRVIGVMAHKGQVLGFDLDDTVYIPVSKALGLFNRDSLVEIDLLYEADRPADAIAQAARRLLIQRHGQEDFTVITQQQMLDVLGSVLDVLTFAVSALGGISLLVGAVGIVTIQSIAVTERRAEIGLLMALGARRGQVAALFLGEAILLSALGGAAGLLLGVGGSQLLQTLLPALPVHTAWPYAVMAELLAISIGLLAGVAPALHAAHREPLEALREE